MERRIEKCRICGEPYYSYQGDTSNDGTCPDCKRKAEEKEYRERNQPKQ